MSYQIEVLTGVVEVDESHVRGEKPGKRGRGTEGKALVVVAVEDKADKGIGRIVVCSFSDFSRIPCSASPFLTRKSSNMSEAQNR